MKGFLKFIGAVTAIFAAVVSALLVFDRLSNKNRIEGSYLECSLPDECQDTEE